MNQGFSFAEKESCHTGHWTLATDWPVSPLPPGKAAHLARYFYCVSGEGGAGYSYSYSSPVSWIDVWGVRSNVIFLEVTSLTRRRGTVLGPLVVLWRTGAKCQITPRPAHVWGILSHWHSPGPPPERLKQPPSCCCTCSDTSCHSQYQTRSGEKCQNTRTN